MAPRKRTPEQEETRRALQRLVQYPEYAVFVEYFRGRIYDVAIDPTDPNAGALSRLEGRRSFHRDIEALPARVKDERRGGTSGE